MATKPKSDEFDFGQIQALIKFVSKSGASEVELETQEFKILIKTPASNPVQIQAAAPAPAPVAAAPAPAPVAPVPAATPATAAEVSAEDENANLLTIKSPMIGTFYRSASPDKPSFVNVGDQVNAGEVVCIVEAMKLFNEIESEISGKIVKVLVDDSSPIEYDQPLFLVDPS